MLAKTAAVLLVLSIWFGSVLGFCAGPGWVGLPSAWASPTRYKYHVACRAAESVTVVSTESQASQKPI